MPLDEAINRFRSELGGGYSRTSNELYADTDSLYVCLYDLVIQHITDSEQTQIFNSLKLLRKKMLNGLLYEKPELVSQYGHDTRYTTLHLSSIYYQLANIYYHKHPVIDAMSQITKKKLAIKLDELDHSDAWRVSNEVMAYAVLLAFNAEKGVCVNGPLWCYEYVKKKQDPATGLWLSTKRPSLINGVAASFHYLPLYDYLDQSLNYPEKITRALLSMRLPNGFFSSPAGYACIDYDCIAILLFLVRQNIKQEFLKESEIVEIGECAERLRNAVLELQNSNGGFPEFGVNVRPIVDTYESLVSFAKHRCASTLVWNLKKIGRLWLRP